MASSKDLILETLQAQWGGLPTIEFADVQSGDMLETAHWNDDQLHFTRGIAHHLSEPYNDILNGGTMQNWKTEGGQHLMRPNGRARLMSRGNVSSDGATP